MSLRIGVMGAGAIGCYVGGRLASTGEDVVLVGRERIKHEIAAAGLTVSGLDGAHTVVVPKERIRYETELVALADSDVVLCCVKSAQSADAARQLASVLRADTIVVSLQNGVRNAEILRAGLARRTVLDAIVGFNVVSKGEGVFRQATTGPVIVEASDGDARVTQLGAMLERAGLEVELARDIRPLQWSKLVINLTNAVSALTDQPTTELLFGRGYRRSLAAIMSEAITVLHMSRTRTARLGPLPVGVFPFLLRLPAPLLRLVMAAQLKVDPEARSSMWQDLSQGRKTEVDHLNGEIVTLAQRGGLRAPVNARVVEMVHEAERRGQGSPKLTADALWAQLTN